MRTSGWIPMLRLGFTPCLVALVAVGTAGAYPTTGCVSSKQKAAARYCKAALRAWSSWETSQNTGARTAALDTAAASLGAGWTQAEAASEAAGVDCADTTLSDADARGHIDAAIDGIVNAIDIGLDLGTPGQASCGSRLVKAAGGVCGALLKAEGKYIRALELDPTPPSGTRRSARRTTSSPRRGGSRRVATARPPPPTPTSYFPNWNFAGNLPPEIPELATVLSNGSGIPGYTEVVANRFPQTRWAHYTTAFDGSFGGQTGFYNLMLNGNNPVFALTWWHGSCAFNSVMRAQAIATSTAVPSNYRYYIGTGSRHTMWGSNKVYTDTTGGVPTLVSWVGAMLDGTPAWTNVECTNCGLLLTNDPRPSPLEAPFEAVGSDVVVNCP